MTRPHNVECGGGGRATWNLGKGRGIAEPCGWKGQREGFYDSLATPRWRNVNLTKPCPWCKGRVELIDGERGS